MACERSYGVVSRHDSNAVDAASKARSTSSSRDNGADAYTWPVEGSITSYVSPPADGTSSPLITLTMARSMRSSNPIIGTACNEFSEDSPMPRRIPLSCDPVARDNGTMDQRDDY